MFQHNESLETLLFYDCSLSEDGKKKQLLEAYERVRVRVLCPSFTPTPSPQPQDGGRFINDVHISLQ